MSAGSLSHRGFEIRYDEDVAADLDEVAGAETIDGVPVNVVISGVRVDAWRLRNGKYFSRHLPYTVHETVEDLAKAVINDSPDFDTSAGDDK